MNHIKTLQDNLIAIMVRKLTMRRAFMLLAIQDGSATCNSEFVKKLRVSSQNINLDLRGLVDRKLIMKDKHIADGDKRHQRYCLTKLGHQYVIAIALTK